MKGPCPYHRVSAAAPPPTDRRVTLPGEWLEPKRPGDSILEIELARDGEIGDIRVQWYDGSLRVAAFTPGYETSSPGDTPKMNPDRYEWTEDKQDAAAKFVQYVIAAFREGWKLYVREGVS